MNKINLISLLPEKLNMNNISLKMKLDVNNFKNSNYIKFDRKNFIILNLFLIPRNC